MPGRGPSLVLAGNPKFFARHDVWVVGSHCHWILLVRPVRFGDAGMYDTVGSVSLAGGVGSIYLRMNLDKPVQHPGSKGRMSDFILISDGRFHFAQTSCMPSAE